MFKSKLCFTSKICFYLNFFLDLCFFNYMTMLVFNRAFAFVVRQLKNVMNNLDRYSIKLSIYLCFRNVYRTYNKTNINPYILSLIIDIFYKKNFNRLYTVRNIIIIKQLIIFEATNEYFVSFISAHNVRYILVISRNSEFSLIISILFYIKMF